MTAGALPDRVPALLTRLSAFPLGLLALCVLQSAVDHVDPTAGDLERVLGLFLVAFAASGVVADLAREPAPSLPPSPTTSWVLRRALLLLAVPLVVLAVTGLDVGPLVDGTFVLGVLLLAATTLGLPAPVGTAGRVAVPVALGAVLLCSVVAAVRLASVV